MRLLIFLALLISLNARAQYISSSQIVSCGGFYKTNGIQMEWSLGDLAIDTYKNFNFLTQGFIQGEKKLTLGHNESTNNNPFNALKGYPNPFNEGLNLEVINTKANDYINISIYNIIGKEVFYQNNAGSVQYIDLSHLASSIYIAKVYVNNKLTGSIKISKL